MPDEAAYFRDQAARCQKLAVEVEDPSIRERLLTLAAEYARRAEAPRIIRPPRKTGHSGRT